MTKHSKYTFPVHFCSPNPPMTRQKKSHQIAAAQACEGKAFKNVAVKVNSDIDTVVTSWTGGVNNHELEQEWIDLDELSEEEVSELEGDDLIESLRRRMEHEEKQLNSQAVASRADYGWIWAAPR